jgi:hypothetical protein
MIERSTRCLTVRASYQTGAHLFNTTQSSLAVYDTVSSLMLATRWALDLSVSRKLLTNIRWVPSPGEPLSAWVRTGELVLGCRARPLAKLRSYELKANRFTTVFVVVDCRVVRMMMMTAGSNSRRQAIGAIFGQRCSGFEGCNPHR